MSARLRPGAGLRTLRAAFDVGPWALLSLLALASSSLGCGGNSASLVAPIAPPAEEWPALAPATADAVDVRSALACAEGAQIRVRAYLVAVTSPCPACSVGERSGAVPEGKIGKSPPPRTRMPDMPGCLPCPAPAATFSDEAPTASATPSAPLRAVGAAEALQPRHIGRPFLLTGTFHAKGALGPELDVTDVRALEGR